MPLATLYERLITTVVPRAKSMRKLSGNGNRSLKKRNSLRLEVCEPRCTPAVLLNVGTHELLPNTPDQRIDIFLESTDPANDPEFELMNYVAEIGDAPHLSSNPNFDPYPNFQTPDFTGTIWDAFPNDLLDLTGDSSPYHAEGNIVFDNEFQQVAPDGKIITLIVDTTGFDSGEFPLKFADVGEEFGIVADTTFSYRVEDPVTSEISFPEADVTITNGLIRIVSVGNAPSVDLNGTGAGNNFNAYFTEGNEPLAIVGASGNPAATIADADSATLTSASINLTGVQDGANEVLAVDTSGTLITANYNASQNTLTLSGSDTIANYQQVLRTLTYQNNAAPLTPAVRSVSVTVSDGTSNSVAATSSVTAYDLSFDWHNEVDPTNVDAGNTGTTINDALIIVSDLRTAGTRQLPPTAPLGTVDFVDVDRNNLITINDALEVVSRLRTQLQGSGEAPPIVEKVATSSKADAPVPLGIMESDLNNSESDDNDHDLAILAVLGEESQKMCSF